MEESTVKLYFSIWKTETGASGLQKTRIASCLAFGPFQFFRAFLISSRTHIQRKLQKETLPSWQLPEHPVCKTHVYMMP